MDNFRRGRGESVTMGVMPRSSPLPSRLRGSAFGVRDTEWHGLSEKRLRGRDVDAPFHGVRSIGIDTHDIRGLCLAYEPLLVGSRVFCGVTAAILLGMPLPLRLGTERLLHVGTLDARQPPRRRGVVGHRLAQGTRTTDVPGGFTVTDAASTWCQLAAELSREELTAIADYLLSGRPLSGTRRSDPLCSQAELKAAVCAHGERVGVAKLRWALDHARAGVDSAPETALRLLLLEKRFAEPIIGLPVGVEGGAITLHPDLAWPELRVVLEYEGDGHRESRRQFRADIRRREMFEAAGWRVIRVTADDLGPLKKEFIARVHSVLAARVRERRLLSSQQTQ